MVPAIGELAGVPVEQPRTSLVRGDHPARLGEGFALGVSLVTIALLAWGAVHDWPTIRASWPELLAWTAALAILNLLDVATESGANVTPALPLLVAISVAFPPGAAGAAAFLGGLDRREVRRSIAPVPSLFNRSQVALTTMTSSFVVHPLHARGAVWYLAALSGAIAFAAATVLNYSLAASAQATRSHTSPLTAVKHLRVGRTSDFVATWLGWGLLGLLLATAYDVMRLWALVVFAVLSIVGREFLERSKFGLVKAAEARSSALAIRELQASISEERRDERRLIALQIHDEVQQAVQRVSLITQVIRQDLAHGRLLDLDDDIPMLVSASEQASGALRGLIRGFLETSVVPNSLVAALRALADDLHLTARATISVEAAALGAVPQDMQLTAYHICREALGNAIQHANATHVVVRLHQDDEYLRLSVEDNGIGFDPSLIPGDRFGILIMRERAAAAGGVATIESTLGAGTIVAARIPIEAPRPSD